MGAKKTKKRTKASKASVAKAQGVKLRPEKKISKPAIKTIAPSDLKVKEIKADPIEERSSKVEKITDIIKKAGRKYQNKYSNIGRRVKFYALDNVEAWTRDIVPAVAKLNFIVSAEVRLNKRNKRDGKEVASFLAYIK